MEEAEAVEGAAGFGSTAGPGRRFGPLRRGPDRAGAVLASGPAREDALERARRAAQAVRFLSMRKPSSTGLGFQPPAIGDEEIAAVTETLRSGWLTTWPRAALLEERMAAYLEAEHVLAVASGTAALHLALARARRRAGDEVITSPITWPATANVIEHCGATPVFCDVRESDLNIDPELIPACVNERTKAIAPGPPRRTAGRSRPDPGSRPPGRRGRRPRRRESLPRPQDRRHLGRPCFSLYATKNVAAGEGGLIATNRDDIAVAVRDMRLTRRGDGSLYDQITAGFKANLSDVLAAIALVQLDRIDAHTIVRERQFALYDEGLAGLEGIEPLARDERDVHALHLYIIRIDASKPARAGTTTNARWPRS